MRKPERSGCSNEHRCLRSLSGRKVNRASCGASGVATDGWLLWHANSHEAPSRQDDFSPARPRAALICGWHVWSEAPTPSFKLTCTQVLVQAIDSGPYSSDDAVVFRVTHATKSASKQSHVPPSCATSIRYTFCGWACLGLNLRRLVPTTPPRSPVPPNQTKTALVCVGVVDRKMRLPPPRILPRVPPTCTTASLSRLPM